MMQKMKGAIDPSMLSKLGGMDNVMNMMKDIWNSRFNEVNGRNGKKEMIIIIYIKIKA